VEEIFAMKMDIKVFQTTKQISLKTCFNKTTKELVLYAEAAKEM
jgi:hypothetical protein